MSAYLNVTTSANFGAVLSHASSDEISPESAIRDRHIIWHYANIKHSFALHNIELSLLYLNEMETI